MAEIIKNKNKIIFFNLLSTIVLQGLTFFAAPIFSSVLGTANYGIVSVYNTWVSIFSTVCSLQAASTIALARSNYKLEEQEKYQSSVLSMAVLIYIIFATASLLLLSKWKEQIGLTGWMLPLALLQGLGNYCVTIINSKFTYEFKAVQNFLLSVCLSIFNIGLSLVLITQFSGDNNYWGRIIGQVVSYLLFGLFAYFFIFIRGRTLYNKNYWKFSLPIAFPTVFHLLAGLLLGQSDRLMIQQFLDNSSVGIYTLAASFSIVIQSIWVAFNNSWAPFYYEYTRLNQIEEMKKKAQNYVELFSVITCGFILLSKEVYHLFADPRYWDGTMFVPMFALGYYFVFMYSFPVNFEFYHKKTKPIAVATTIAAFFNIVLNFFMIKKYGILGAVIATTIAHGLQFLCHLIFAKKMITKEFPFELTFFIPGFTMVFICLMGNYFITDFTIVRWAIGFLIGVFELYKIVKRKSIF